MSAIGEWTARWVGCERCSLRAYRQNVVVGEPWINGDHDGHPLILFVGEAPGAVEDATGRPFVGPSGKILREMLVDAGCRWGFITNLTACRPPPTRKVIREEIEACAPRLLDLVEILDPDGVAYLGGPAADASGEWKAGFDRKRAAELVQPAALLHQRFPNPSASTKMRDTVKRLHNLLVRLGMPVVSEDDLCEHEFVAAGRWVSGRGERPIRACVKCGLMEGR